MKKYSASLCLFSSLLLLSSCGQKKQESTSDSQDTAQVKIEQVVEAADSSEVSSASEDVTVIDGMSFLENPKIALKAGIIDNHIQWDITDVAKFKKATETWDEFYRIGEGPFYVECPKDEDPIGVFLADRNKHRNLVLFVITSKHHVLAYDIIKEVAMVGGGIGLVSGLEDVVNLNQEGNNVYAINSQGDKTAIKLYDDEGPYEFSFNYEEKEYYVSLSNVWTARFALNGGHDVYHGSFKRIGKGKYSFVLDCHEVVEDGIPNALDEKPIEGVFRLDNSQDMITFESNVLGLPKGKAVSYEVIPLFD